MKFDYKSFNFISTPKDNDKRIRIYDKDGNLKYSIEPNFDYAYIKNNCLYIKIKNKNDIKLTFENKNESIIALSKLLEAKLFFTENIINDDKNIYIGDWRISEVDGNLKFDKKVDGVWELGGEFYI